MRSKVATFILAGEERSGWLNPLLLTNVLRMSGDDKIAASCEVVIRKPVDVARNVCIATARDQHADYCLMIDNDQFYCGNLLDVVKQMEESGIDVCGIPSGMVSGTGNYCANLQQVHPLVWDKFHKFFRVTWIGTGCTVVSARVWEKVPAPWFRSVIAEDGMSLQRGEDQYFCDLVQQHGFNVWGFHQMLGHLHTTDITALYAAREAQVRTR